MRGWLAIVAACGISAASIPPHGLSAARQTPRDPRTPRVEANGSLVGRVVAADTNQPVRWATVTISGRSGQGTFTTSTDADGAYRFNQLPNGLYTGRVSKAGFVTMPYGAQRYRDPGSPVQVVDAGVATADVRLPRGGAIEGRILTFRGDPAQDVTVQAQRVGYDSTGRRIFPVGSPARTDDLGSFRLHSLPPGQYLVEATFRSPPSAPMGNAPIRTYFPGTSSAGEAQRVNVDAARTSTASFSMGATVGSALAGTIVDSRARAPQRTTVMLRSAGNITLGTMYLPESRNVFGFTPVPPGEYILIAIARTAGVDLEFAVKRITMGGENLSGMEIQTAPGATLEGLLQFDIARGTAPPASVAVTAHNTLFPGLVDDPNQLWSPSPVGADGRFAFHSLVGPRLFRVNVPPPWAIRSVRLDDADVTDAPVDFQGPSASRKLGIVVTDRTGRITGTLTADPAYDIERAHVVVLSEDEPSWGFGSRFTKAARVGAAGRFMLPAILPGRYLVAVMVDPEADAWMDPDVLRDVRGSAMIVTVEEGADTNVSLTLGKPR
jgi:hypothetical protein